MSSSVKEFTATIAAGARTKLPGRGSFLFMKTTTGAVSVSMIENELGGASGKETRVTMQNSDKIRSAPGAEFDEIVLHNESASSVTLTIIYGDGDYDRPVPDTVNVSVSLPNAAAVTTVTDKTNIDVANAGKELLLAANENRINAWITALDTNAEAIRIGDDNVAIDRGTPLAAGDTILWSSKSACYACSIATVNQGAAVTEFETS